MPIDFPDNPTNGQVFETNNQIFIWRDPPGAWTSPGAYTAQEVDDLITALGIDDILARLAALEQEQNIPFEIELTGLDGGIARIGDTIGYSIVPDIGPQVVQWGTAFNDDTFGTDPTADDFASADDAILALTVSVGPVARTRSAPVRRYPAQNTVLPSLSGTTGLGDEITFVEGTWTGAVGGSFTRVIQRFDGVDWVDLPGLTHTFVVADSETPFRPVERYQNSGGTVVAIGATVTADLFSAPGAVTAAMFNVTTGAVGAVNIEIVSLPAANGSPIDDILYEINGSGVWLPTGDIVDFSIPGLDPNTLVAVALRAANGIDTGPAGPQKQAVTGASKTITFSASYTPGSGGQGPRINVSNIVLTGAVLPLDYFYATHPNGTTLSDAEVIAGTGAVLNASSVLNDADGEVVDEELTLTESFTDGHITILVRDDTTSPAVIGRLTIDGVDVDATPPVLVGSSPSDDAVDVALDEPITLTLSKNVLPPTIGGEFYLVENAGPTIVETFDVEAGIGSNGGTISAVGDDILIDPGANYTPATVHSVQWSEGAVIDEWGNPLAANSTDTLISFTTAGAPVATPPEFMGMQILAGDAGVSGLYSFTFPDLVAGTALLGLLIGDTGTNTPGAITIAGVAAAAIPDAVADGANRSKALGYQADIGAGNTAVTIQMDDNVGRFIGVGIWIVPTGGSIIDAAGYANGTANVDEAMTIALDGEAGDYMLAAAGFLRNTVDGNVVTTNITRHAPNGFAGGTFSGDVSLVEGYIHEVATTENRTISVRNTTAIPNRQAFVGFTWRPAA
jgi:hypothetical protein